MNDRAILLRPARVWTAEFDSPRSDLAVLHQDGEVRTRRIEFRGPDAGRAQQDGAIIHEQASLFLEMQFRHCGRSSGPRKTLIVVFTFSYSPFPLLGGGGCFSKIFAGCRSSRLHISN